MRAADRRVVAAAVAVALGASLIVVGVVLRRPERSPPSGNLPAVPAVRAVELGPIDQDGRVTARDNGQSTAYGDRSVWVFGDTVLRDPEGFLSNSAASTTDRRAADGVDLSGSVPTPVITHTPSESAFELAHGGDCSPAADLYCGAKFAFWPGPVIADPRRGRVLIFYVKLCRDGGEGTPCSGTYGRPLGTGIAALDMRTRRVTRLDASRSNPVLSVEGPDPTMFFPPSDAYNTAALTIGGDAYVYGACSERCHLARVPLDRIGDRSRWRFYSGREADGQERWSAETGAAVDTVEAGAAGNTVFPVRGLNGWLNVYLPYGDNVMRAQVGASPSGPWSPDFPLFTTRGADVNYAGFGHPEYAERDDLVQYVTYFQADTGDLRLVKLTLES
ncbi:DUF4185 domain-containing protein [Cryptosporangium arvum]|uniref:DUF4185 domain-containing protein n=1 Tax=Cryptosporangium arvum DSM 44712 TaxID=927661 RepID=A0A010ZSZ2_9ACTN|nr:DUF4185 domain-containing protein [Cryptosporangium arvum]EXG81799.1 hypothetical protein CryarDRAFT_2919 [Cryptosporangium arvum DSM 44712]